MFLLVLAYPGSQQRTVRRLCVCVCGISAQQNQGWRTKSHRECSQMFEEHTTAIVRKKSTEKGDKATIDQLDSVFPTAAP